MLRLLPWCLFIIALSTSTRNAEHGRLLGSFRNSPFTANILFVGRGGSIEGDEGVGEFDGGADSDAVEVGDEQKSPEEEEGAKKTDETTAMDDTSTNQSGIRGWLANRRSQNLSARLSRQATAEAKREKRLQFLEEQREKKEEKEKERLARRKERESENYSLNLSSKPEVFPVLNGSTVATSITNVELMITPPSSPNTGTVKNKSVLRRMRKFSASYFGVHGVFSGKYKRVKIAKEELGEKVITENERRVVLVNGNERQGTGTMDSSNHSALTLASKSKSTLLLLSNSIASRTCLVFFDTGFPKVE